MNARLPTVLLVALKVTALSKSRPFAGQRRKGTLSAATIAVDYTGPNCANAAVQLGYQTRQSILTEVLIQIHAS